MVTFDAKGPAKATVSVAHERLADPDAARSRRPSGRRGRRAQGDPGVDPCLSPRPAGGSRLRRVATLARRPAVVAHWGTDEIIAVDPDGNREVVAHGPGGLGWSIDWLPDGRLLVTGRRARRAASPTGLVPHADLGGLAETGTRSSSTAAATPTSTAGSSDFRPARRGSSRSSRRTARCARWPTGSRSPTAWSSRPTTGR